jgi:methionyl-tRNA formyltransferase
MKIVFFGSPDTALLPLQKLMESGHTVELVITQPDRPSGRGKKLLPPPVKTFALEHSLPVLQPVRIRKDPDVLNKLKEIKPDIHIVVAYGQIIPASIIYLPQHNTLNIHFSLLPEYRGASPVQWTLLNGDEKTGVTIFELDEKMDEGPILSQAELEIGAMETAPELEDRLTRLGTDLLLKTLNELNRFTPVPQDHSRATYAPLLKKEDGRISWIQTAERIFWKKRAFTPWPSIFTFFQSKRIKIHDVVWMKEESHSRELGEILSVDGEGIRVGCGSGSVLLIRSLQPENKNSMDAFSFSLGARIKPGQFFD